MYIHFDAIPECKIQTDRFALTISRSDAGCRACSRAIKLSRIAYTRTYYVMIDRHIYPGTIKLAKNLC